MKTAEKPSTNPTAFFSVFVWLSSCPLPAKYVIYTGSMGNKQGEIKEINPSMKVKIYCINIRLSVISIITLIIAKNNNIAVTKSHFHRGEKRI